MNCVAPEPNNLESCSASTDVTVSSHVAGTVSNTIEFVGEDCADLTFRGRSNKHFPRTEFVDVKEYLARPTVLKRGVFDATLRGTFYSVNMTFATFLTTYGVSARLLGTVGVRATLCFRLQLAVQPFNAGVIAMAWDPNLGETSRQSRIVYTNSISMLPHVRLDLADMTSVELKVPFLSPHEYIPILGPSMGTSALGTVALHAFLPYASGVGALPPSYTLYTWLEDVEPVGATVGTILAANPQSGAVSLRESSHKKMSENIAATAAVLSQVSEGVPLLSSYTGSTAWFLKTLARGAEAFGWSKPVNNTSVNRMMVTRNTYQHNFDGTNTTYNIGASADNSISPSDCFANCEYDEMALAYLLSKWGLISNFRIATAGVPGTLVYACALAPPAMTYQNKFNLVNTSVAASYAAVTYRLTTPASFIGNCFNSYRGTFRFRFTAARTQFHGARLRFIYINTFSQTTAIPQVTGVSTSDTASNLPITAIWDLRESSTFEFECPYLDWCQYKTCSQAYGALNVFIEDGLTSPTTVAAYMDFSVEVQCAPDFEFAVPNGEYFLVGPVAGVPTAQSGMISLAAQQPDMSLHCIGERILSVKQLISRASLYATRFVSAKTPAGSTAAAPLILNPGFANVWNEFPTGGTQALAMDDTLSYFATCYGYARGSTCFDISAFLPNSRITVLPTTDQVGDVTWNQKSSSIISEYGSDVHVTLPFYSQQDRKLLYPKGTFREHTVVGQCYVTTTLAAQAPTPTPVPYACYRRAGDDFQFGMFLGTPMLSNWTEQAGRNNALSIYSESVYYPSSVTMSQPISTNNIGVQSVQIVKSVPLELAPATKVGVTTVEGTVHIVADEPLDTIVFATNPEGNTKEIRVDSAGRLLTISHGVDAAGTTHALKVDDAGQTESVIWGTQGDFRHPIQVVQRRTGQYVLPSAGLIFVEGEGLEYAAGLNKIPSEGVVHTIPHATATL